MTVSAPFVGLPDSRGGWAMTFSGRRFFPAAPHVDAICIDDIAHSLAHQCRFAGHAYSHYSVAQHSVLVAELCSTPNKMVGLLHDATEAYLQDIIRPLKQALGDGYRDLERQWSETLGLVFGLGERLVNLPEEVHRADRMVLVAERYYLLAPAAWPDEARYPHPIDPWSAARAKAEFLRHFRLFGGAA